MRDAGFEGIELNSFMINPMPMMVRTLTRMAGMPVGKSGHLDWHSLIGQSGLSVVSVHSDLGTILRAPDQVIDMAKSFSTDTVVVTGMHRFDFSNKNAVLELSAKLNKAGKQLSQGSIRFLYHNHNCEFLKIAPDMTAYQLILEETDPDYVGFEYDSYWACHAGVDTLSLMKTLGKRMELYHINDRGPRASGKAGSILKSDSRELGYGNMNLVELVNTATKNGVKAIVLESHKNWAENSAVKSFQLSSKFMNQHIV